MVLAKIAFPPTSLMVVSELFIILAFLCCLLSHKKKSLNIGTPDGCLLYQWVLIAWLSRVSITSSLSTAPELICRVQSHWPVPIGQRSFD